MLVQIDEEDLIEEFKKRDKNGDGTLDISEIEEIFTEVYKRYEHEIKESRVEWIKRRSDAFLKSLDANEDKKLTLEEFLKFFNQK